MSIPSERLVLEAQLPSDKNIWAFMTNAVLNMPPDTASTEGALQLVRFDHDAPCGSPEFDGQIYEKVPVKICYSVSDSTRIALAITGGKAGRRIETHSLITPTIYLRMIGGTSLVDLIAQPKILKAYELATSQHGLKVGSQAPYQQTIRFQRAQSETTEPYIQEPYIIAE